MFMVSLRPVHELTLPRVQGDVLFVIYTLPTVVISRRTDQYGKVRCKPLCGATNHRDDLSPMLQHPSC